MSTMNTGISGIASASTNADSGSATRIRVQATTGTTTAAHSAGR